MTRAEKLRNKIGSKVECDFCHHKKTFTSSWLMTNDEAIACLDCKDIQLKQGKVLVSIL